MANTYSQCYFHIVFAVKNRNALIKKEWKDELEKYLTAIIQNSKHKLLAIGSMPDHIHIFIGYNLNQPIPNLIEQLKTSTNHWINKQKLTKYHFEWQQGYGVFTHSRSQIDRVAKYVLNQETHHKMKPFKEEYLQILNKNAVSYSEEYLFVFFDDIFGWN